MKIKRDFNSILSKLEKSIYGFEWITDFEKCIQNIENYKKSIEIVQKLIFSENFDFEFKKACIHNIDVLKVFMNMLCLREGKHITFSNYKFSNSKIEIDKKEYDLSKWTNDIENYLHLIKQSGLIEFLKTNKSIDINSFLMGIECGMDTNGRKNRSGQLMEKIIESYFKTYNLQYFKQFKLSTWIKNNQLSKKTIDYISSKNKEKVFDFAVFYKDIIYLIEVNFFSSGGSKLDAIANNFKQLSLEINNLDDVKFVWITDGEGWNSTKREFNDAYNKVEYLYTIYDLDKNIFE